MLNFHIFHEKPGASFPISLIKQQIVRLFTTQSRNMYWNGFVCTQWRFTALQLLFIMTVTIAWFELLLLFCGFQIIWQTNSSNLTLTWSAINSSLRLDTQLALNKWIYAQWYALFLSYFNNNKLWIFFKNKIQVMQAIQAHNHTNRAKES